MRKRFVAACRWFVKKMSVKGGLLPTNSDLTPELVRKIFFCTFADVTKYPDLRAPSPEGRRHRFNFSLF